MTLGMLGITAGSIKGMGFIRVDLDNVVWKAFSNCTTSTSFSLRLVLDRPELAVVEFATIFLPLSFPWNPSLLNHWVEQWAFCHFSQLSWMFSCKMTTRELFIKWRYFIYLSKLLWKKNVIIHVWFIVMVFDNAMHSLYSRCNSQNDNNDSKHKHLSLP